VALTQVVRGLGGIGKTQLALEYAYRYGGAYRLVWWLRAEEPTTLAADYAALADPLQLPQHTAHAQAETIAAVRQWLEGHDGWLLILDNAPEPAAIHPYLPRSRRGPILVTSRKLGWGGTARALTVPVLPREVSVALLLERTQQADTTAARAVAAMLGDLPLALAQAAAYIAATGLSVAAYGARLEARLAELLRRGEVGPEYPATVATTWALALQAIEACHPAASSLLRLCAFCAPEAIPCDLIRANASALPVPLAALVADDLQWDEALAALRRYALVETTDEMIAVHRLVQAVTRDRLSVEEQAHWAGVVIQLLVTALPLEDVSREPKTWPIYAQLVPHALAAVQQGAHARSASETTGFLWHRVGAYFGARAHYVEAQAACQQALAIYEQGRGPTHPDTAECLHDLGYLLQAQGDLTGARLYYERALAIYEQVLGPTHHETARGLHDLGTLLQAQGDLGGARPYVERALAIYEQVLGPTHLYTARSLHNLSTLLQAQGDLAGARAALKQSLSIYQACLGEAHPFTQMARGQLEALEPET